MITQEDMAAAYQPLFDFMIREYGTKLVKSEMDEIIEAVNKVNENISEFWRIKCDVEGCNATATTQGIFYSEFIGYCSLCSHHSDKARKGSSVPQFKAEAIEREKSRKPDGCLPTQILYTNG